ncbi:hypothetical protein GJAV_G00000420 [Gymnothorax javanicus]|nr:hypothetical protein GJAV_G00000420 [Gymnothorax javanicus]
MTKIAAAYFGLLVLVAYFATPVYSQNGTNITTTSPPSNTTAVTTAYNTTMTQADVGNTTTPSGASLVRGDAFSVLLPVAMVACFVSGRC